jgi:hypothetical protein
VCWALSAPASAETEKSPQASDGRPLYPGRAETLALARAYPKRITDVEFRDGDWAVRIDERWFYWANGRLLPHGKRDQWEDYASHRFYAYRPGLPPLRQVDPADASRLENYVSGMAEDPPARDSDFLDALYRAETRAETEARITAYSFLGFRTRVHADIVGALERVEAEITSLVEGEPGVGSFLETLRLVGGFSWRVIAGTGTRSYHSYGVAVDLIPQYYGRKHAYWRWAMEAGVEAWWAVPYERRWMPPLSVIEVFEKHGFVWGGKWLFFDTIHFEYRPEIHALARLDPQNRRPITGVGFRIP